MEEIPSLCSFQQCRLCGSYGLHQTDIFNGNAGELCEQIYRCVGVWVSPLSFTVPMKDSTEFRAYFQVKRNDRITKKLCEKCVDRINGFVLYRKICAATNIQLKLNGEAVGVANELNAVQKIDPEATNLFRKCSFPSSNPPVAYVSLIEDETQRGNDQVNAESDTGRCDVSEQNRESSDPDPYMSPLEYETESEDGTHDKEACSTLEQKAAVVHPHSEMASGIKSIEEKGRDQGRKSAKNTVFECRMCRQNFQCSDLVSRHDTQKLYRCHVCQKSYRSKQWLRKHMDVTHLDKIRERFRCLFPACSKSFSQKSTLNRHIRIKHVQKVPPTSPSTRILLANKRGARI